MAPRWHVLAISALLAMQAAPALAAGPYQDRAAVLAALPRDPLPGPAAQGHEPRRLVAATLALTLGPFGAHRLYLGTDAKVPVLYGITFGGFGVLVLIDLAHIVLAKDLAPYQDNTKVFMWGEAPQRPLTPP